MARLSVIRASEVAEFTYCARAWWLRRVQGYQPTGRERREHGVALHAHHGRSVQISTLLLWLALMVCLAAIILLWLLLH